MKRILLCTALVLGACASDPSSLEPPPGNGGGDPGPVVLEDGHVFRLFTMEDGAKAPRLRWVGDGDGPFVESPEQSDEPWIGFGVPFRLEWEITSKSGRVTGYQYRFDHAEGTPFYPRSGAEDVYADVSSLDFSATNSTEGLDPACYNDPDCFREIRLDSGVYPLEVRAIDDSGRTRSETQFQLRFHINYAPMVIMQEDGIAGCAEPAHFPRYEFVPESGPVTDCALLRGDTIPSGSTVRIRLDGVDRYDTANFPDDPCCDEPGDGGEQDVRFTAQVEIFAESDRGATLPWFTFYGPETDQQELEFKTGPFDYVINGRSVDEHARRSEVGGRFEFSSGHDPEIVSVSPHDGAKIFLRSPVDGVWPENEVGYETVMEVRYWDPDAQRVLRFPADGRVSITGHIYRIPLRFLGQPNPSEPAPLEFNPTIHGGVLAWAYEWIGEFDPENVYQDGGGFDDLGAFSESPLTNLWEATGTQAVEVWIPLELWFQPALYLDDPDPASKEAVIAGNLREQLGAIDLMVRGRGSWAAVVERCPPMTPEQRVDNEALLRCLPEQPLLNVGRYTETVSHRLEMRLGLDRGATGSMTELWPAPSAKHAPRPTDEDILRRIQTPRENG